MSSYPPRLARLDLLALAAILLWTAALLAPMLRTAYTGDEIALVERRGFYDIFLSAESASNPPLQRLLLNLPVRSTMGVLRAGRALSFLCTLGAVAIAFLLGRRLGGGELLAGVAAALLVAGNPRMLEEGAHFRSYALWMIVALWHWHALDRATSGDDRGARLAMAVSAAILPWLHYSSVVVLLAEGIALVAARRWRLVRTFVPAAIGSTPLLWPLVLPHGVTWHQPTDTPGRLLARLYDAGFDLSRAEGYAVAAAAPAIAIVVAATFAVLPLRVAVRPVARIAAITYGLTLAGLIVLGQYREVRPPGALWLAPPVIVVLSVGPALARTRGVRLAVWVYFAAAAILSGAAFRDPPESGQGAERAATDWSTWKRIAAGRPIRVVPDYASRQFILALTGKLDREMDRPVDCPKDEPCIDYDGVRVLGGGNPAADGSELVLVLVCWPDAQPPRLCPPFRREPCLTAYDCRGGGR